MAGQTAPPRRVWVRDDGSTDATAAILAAWADRVPIAPVHDGAGRLGPGPGFLALLAAAALDPDPAELIGFCDQDDVWAPGKLAAARDALAPLAGREALYCGRQLYVDARLRPLGRSPWPRRRLGLETALVENIATGCTVVMTRALAARVARHLPARAVMHDWWCYLVASAFGTVLFDPVPRIRYRQHGANAVGAAAGPLGRLARRIRRGLFADTLGPGLDQAREFGRLFGAQLSPGQRRLIAAYADVPDGRLARVARAVRLPVHRHMLYDDAVLRVLYALR